MKSFSCTVVSAEQSIYSGNLTMLSATSVNGDLGILPGHTPLLAQLAPGPLRMKRDDGEEDILYISGGFLEVQPDHVRVLADTVLREGQLSEHKIEQAQKQAMQVIEGKDSSMEYAEAMQHLARAAAQIKTLKEIRNKIK